MSDGAQIPRYTLVLGGAKFPLADGQSYILGRGESCELRIHHPMVSDRHCTVRCEDGKVTVEDLGSELG